MNIDIKNVENVFSSAGFFAEGEAYRSEAS
jgi:hypothetical protein